MSPNSWLTAATSAIVTYSAQAYLTEWSQGYDSTRHHQIQLNATFAIELSPAQDFGPRDRSLAYDFHQNPAKSTT